MRTWVLKTAKVIIGLAVFAWFGVLLSHKIDLTTADLGRHIENGNIIVNGSWAEKWAVLHTNFYSYTMPNAPFINHHWFSGVVFYFLWLWFGFVGLSVFYVALGLATLWLFFDVARKAGNFWIASAVTIIITPLITSRVEVRPEMFTYFLTGVFFWILWHWRKDAHKWARYTWALPPLMLLWINLHIGFVFGFLVLGAFGLEKMINDLRFKIKDKTSPYFSKAFYQLLFVSIACVFAALVNPSFIRGFLYPLYIFKDYGYLIVENQSIRFLESISFTTDMHFLLFKIVGGGIAISFILAAIKDWKKLDIALLVLTAVTGVMAYLGIRNFPSFAFFVLPALAANIYAITPQNIHRAYRYSLSVIVIVMVIVALSQQYQEFLQLQPSLGLGLLPGVEASADFFKANNIAGPIFNDYDVGSYLIYNLQTNGHGGGQQMNTDTKVFVDNRPEAYHTNFFQNIYIPAQEDPAKWQALDKQYNFNAIFFSYRDYTPWAQEFLIARVQDPNWAPVFVDSYNIIFLRRDNPANAAVIKKYELPKSMFGITG